MGIDRRTLALGPVTNRDALERLNLEGDAAPRRRLRSQGFDFAFIRKEMSSTLYVTFPGDAGIARILPE